MVRQSRSFQGIGILFITKHIQRCLRIFLAGGLQNREGQNHVTNATVPDKQYLLEFRFNLIFLLRKDIAQQGR